MTLSYEFQEFYNTWMAKANEYGIEELRDCFDKFFTLFVVYNRLYAESTFALVRMGRIFRLRRGTNNTGTRRRNFPDRKAATEYLQQYLGSDHIMNQLESADNSVNALNKICTLLKEGQFYIKLDVYSGNRQRSEDEKLLRNLMSTCLGLRVNAILDLVYSIRCNMFHGHKGFREVQIELLQPIIVILKSLIEIIFQKLSNEQN